jgi:hypothetical protein
MTKQEIFNKVWAGFEAQNWQRATQGGACKYRTTDGSRKCAAGMLIPDEEYNSKMEGSLVSRLATGETPKVDDNGIRQLSFDPEIVCPTIAALGDPELDFLGALQAAHDTMDAYGRAPEEIGKLLRDNLAAVARSEGLTIPDQQVVVPAVPEAPAVDNQEAE